MHKDDLQPSKEVLLSRESRSILLTDPTDGAGTELREFRLYQTYQVGQNKAKRICRDLYGYVLDRINRGGLASANALLIKYTERYSPQIKHSNRGNQGDYITKSPLSAGWQINHSKPYPFQKYYNYDERNYIVITRDTPHNTRVTIFMRFFDYGEHLYLGVDSYALGKVKWNSVIKRCFVSLLAFLLLITVPSVIQATSGAAFSFPFLWLVFLLIFIISWRDLIIKTIQSRGNIHLALRQAFLGELDSGSFDTDDIMMFLKSSLHTAIIAIQDIFQREGLPLDSLDFFAQNINNINISTGGGAFTMSNSAVGTDNRVSSNSNPQSKNTV